MRRSVATEREDSSNGVDEIEEALEEDDEDDEEEDEEEDVVREEEVKGDLGDFNLFNLTLSSIYEEDEERSRSKSFFLLYLDLFSK